MKIIFIISFLFLNILAQDFKYKIKIDNTMSIDKIINTIENVQDGTVVKFSDGEYDFNNRQINLNQKKYISIEGSSFNKVTVERLKLFVNNSNNVHIKNITYKNNSLIKFDKSINSFINHIILEKTQIAFYSKSTSLIDDVFSQTDFKYALIYINNSNIKINSISLRNNLAACVYGISKSDIQIANSDISSLKKAIDVTDSNIYLSKNIFTQKHAVQKNSIFLNLTQSNLIAISNTFKNNSIAISLASNSKGHIEKNKFHELQYYIFLQNSSSYIGNNEFFNAIGNYSYGIALDNSKANIVKNEFKKIHSCIRLKPQAKANIAQNMIGDLIGQIFTDKNGKQTYEDGLGIIIRKNAFANVTYNTTYNLKYNYIGVANNGSKVYSIGNDKDFDYKFWSDNKKSNKKLIFDIPVVNDFRNNFKNIQISSINYKKLTVYKQKKVIPNKQDIIKGFLTEEIIVTVVDKVSNEEYEDELDIGTYMEFNKKNNTIVEPLEYKGVCLDDVPILKTNSKQRNIQIIPMTKNGNKTLVSFKIISNVEIISSTLNRKKIKFKEINNGYKTISRKIDNLNKTHILNIYGSDFETSYKCRFDDFNELNCYSIQKLEL